MRWQATRSNFWLAGRLLLTGPTRLFSMQGWISIFGLIFGVASLVAAMAVITGFQATLRRSVIDVTGHLQIFKLDPTPEPWQEFFSRLKRLDSRVLAGTRFVMVEGVLAHKGKLNGVLVEGLDPVAVGPVLDLQNRIIEGAFNLQPQQAASGAPAESPPALIGKGIAQNFKLHVGDEFRLVVPAGQEVDVSQFRRHVGTFRVAGVLDLGKYDYDQRWIVTSLKAAQDWAQIGSRYSGLILKTEDANQARGVQMHLAGELGSGYRLRDWREVNENLLEAIDIEKVVIFFVIFIIVIAAAFNVASALYVNVVRSTPAISLLKTLGLSPKRVSVVFSLQGLLLGVCGTLLGFLLGLLFCAGFVFLQSEFGLIQGSVYKIDYIELKIQWTDWLIIFTATNLICWLATWAPANRAARLSPVEGLRQE